jgi:hypothetical protein
VVYIIAGGQMNKNGGLCSYSAFNFYQKFSRLTRFQEEKAQITMQA